MTNEQTLLYRLQTGANCSERGDRCRVLNAESGCDCAAAADEIDRLTRDMAALQSQWDDMQQGFVEVFGEPVRDAIELLGTVERIRSGNEPCEQPSKLQEAIDLLYQCRDTFAVVPGCQSMYERVWKWCQANRNVTVTPEGASRDASSQSEQQATPETMAANELRSYIERQPATYDYCGNWPCRLPKFHTGPCNSSPSQRTFE